VIQAYTLFEPQWTQLTILPAVSRASLRDGADFRSNMSKRLEQFLLGKSARICRLFVFCNRQSQF
jgi:hypothetical protein